MTVKTAISMPDEVFKQIDEAAAEQGLSRSALVVAALEKYLFDLETERLRTHLAALPAEAFALTDEEAEELSGISPRP
jgi:metal-responsive CopG/Arc/MetJ family transcriptional regulator